MKNVVVTGASRGIGRAIAIELGNAGYRVLVNFFKSKDMAKEVVSAIKGMGGEAVAMKADVADYGEVKSMISEFCESYGAIYGLVLNAGIYIRKPVNAMTLEDWDRTVKVNLYGAMYPVKASLSYLENGASIVFISSQLAFRGSTSSVAYSASKAGVLGLMRSLALQLAPAVRVNAVSPGTIDTDIISGYSEEERIARERNIPLQRIGLPEEVAHAVKFLISDESSYITGANIDVNGGLYIH
ncbi:MAG: SDR family oxidoreductase [Euryarchaeota archaeon]|nr:SDR family oxidoreductase [Euryarchaeota archaeon]